MGKKIIVLNGSPRTNGNTAALAAHFVKGAESAGHEVRRFDLQKMDIKPCLGCCAGGKDPKHPCVQRDGMDEIYPAFMEADIVVLASPMYFWSFTAQLKAAIDRSFAVTELDPNYRPPHKECAMLMAAEGDSESNFAPVKDFYASLLGHLGWKDLGMVLAGGVMAPGDIAGHPALEEAEALGASIK